MSNLNVSKFLVAAAVLVTSLFVMCNRASALIVNVLAGVPYTSVTDDYFFEATNANHALDFTDGNTTTGEFFLYSATATPPGTGYYQGTITYDLGSPTAVNLFGLFDGNDAGREHPTSMELDFSNDNFSTVLATKIVSLADVNYQQVSFPDVTAQYVRFVTPLGANAYYTDRSDQSFTTIEELELYHVPEPASLSLLGLGGLLILRRRR